MRPALAAILLALGAAASMPVAAQTPTIEVRVKAQSLFVNQAPNYPEFPHESPQEAFDYLQPFYTGCYGIPPLCTTTSNLRPTGNLEINGVSYYWTWDTTQCQLGVCQPVGQGSIVQQDVCQTQPIFTGLLSGPVYFNPVTILDAQDTNIRTIYCVAHIPIPQPCLTCSRANPIYPSTGQKVQVETDYTAAAGGLQFARTYTSNNASFSSPATSSWVDDSQPGIVLPGCLSATYTDSTGRTHSHCYQYLTTGNPDYRLHTGDGRMIVFGGTPGAITASADVNERVSQRTNAAGAIEWVVVRPDNSTEIYNVQGQLTRRTSLDGREDISYGYSDGTTPATIAPKPGLLIGMADRFGRSLSFTYDTLARVTTMTDPAGGVFQYAYDATGNLASVTYPDAAVRTYQYGEAANINNGTACSLGATAYTHLLTGISDNGQRFATFKYDCNGLAISSEHAGGVEKYGFTYSGMGLSTPSASEVDPLGTSRSYQFKQILSSVTPTSVTQPAASGNGTASVSYTYDANGNVASRTDYNGNRTNYTYDLTRNLETQRVEGLTAAGGTTLQTRTISTQWSTSFRLATRVAEPLRITTYVYGGDGGANCGSAADGTPLQGVLCSKTIQATSDANGSQGFSVTAVGAPRTWTYTYNTNGLPLTIDGPRTDVADLTTYTYYADDDADLGKRGNVASVTNALGQTTSITAYNAHGQPTTIVDANGLTTTLTYDARMRLTSRSVGGELTSYSYDLNGQLAQVTLPDGSSLSYSYDAAHRLVGMSDNLGNRIAYTLDNLSNRTQEQVFDPANALAQTRSRVFNALNRLFQDIGAAGQTTQYAYDNQGNVTSVADPLNHVTTNAYDALNRLAQVTDPNNGITKYGYNGVDQLVSVTDTRNLATTYAYDGLSNLNNQISPDTGTTTNTYDAAGNLLTQRDAKGQTTTYAYDALNRVASITFADGSKQNYGYDQGPNGIGRLTSIVELDPTQNITSQLGYGYDPHGRVTSDTRTIAGVAYFAAYQYDSSGRLSGMTYPSGRTIAYSFDALGRVSQVTSTAAPAQGGQMQTVVQNVQYQPFGGVKSYTLGNGQIYARGFDLDGRIASYNLGAQSFAIGYDAASRISFISDAANPANANNYGYDVLDRLTNAVTPGTPYAYNYDAVGNRTSKTVGSSTDTYAYASTSNQIASITSQSGAVRSFMFDANGSTTNDGTNQYVYDTRGRMVQSIGLLGTTMYQVNALGQRFRKTNSSDDRLFLYDTKGHLISENDPGGGLKREYLYLGDIPVAVVTP
jgi:YD repeat-containing protein